jgi:hypothetical protein
LRGGIPAVTNSTTTRMEMGKVQLAQTEGARQKAREDQRAIASRFRHALFKRVLIALLGNTDHSVVFIISSVVRGGWSMGRSWWMGIARSLSQSNNNSTVSHADRMTDRLRKDKRSLPPHSGRTGTAGESASTNPADRLGCSERIYGTRRLPPYTFACGPPAHRCMID